MGPTHVDPHQVVLVGRWHHRRDATVTVTAVVSSAGQFGHAESIAVRTASSDLSSAIQAVISVQNAP